MFVPDRRARYMDRLRMRTTLLIPLLLLSFGCTVVSLLVIRTIVQQQVRAILASDLSRSVKTYQNIQRQRRELLSRETALLADLPSLKALMTTHDTPTIVDAGVEFWQVSGSDLFALLDADGQLVASRLNDPLQQQLMAQVEELQSTAENKEIQIGEEKYLAASVHLSTTGTSVEVPQLIVLKSFDQATRLTRKVNRWVLTLGLIALLAGTGMLIAISRTLTRPLETLVGGPRALADGNFEYQLHETV